MDFPLNSSLVLAAAVGLWLLWVAPKYLHGKQAPVPSRGGASILAASSAATEPDPSSQGNTMHNTSTGVQHTPNPKGRSGSGAGPAGRPASAPGPLKVRYGRLTLAVLGLIFTLTILAGGAAAVFGAVSGWIPAGAAVGAAAVVISLRTLAVQDQRARRARREAAAARQEHVPSVQAPVRTNPKADAVFDAASEEAARKAEATAEPARPTAPEPKPVPRLTAQELRAAALAEAAKSAEASSWQPVAVPKPTYVDAPAAPRPAPAPLAVPAAPKPVLKTPIRPVAAPAAGSTAIEPRPSTGILNLDDVLQRRRA